MDLDKKDRLILANQYRILEALYPDEAAEFARSRKALENGYKLQYHSLIEFISDEMSEEKCREVLDILDLHRAMLFSLRDKPPSERGGLTEEDVRFLGFDGNNEPEQYSYANYYVNDLGRYQELAEGRSYVDLNSHHETLGRYRNMLRLWKDLPGQNKFKLSPDQIRTILAR